MYYERIVSAVLSQDEVLRATGISSLQNDPGLHQLLPYFVQLVAEKVSKRTAGMFGTLTIAPTRLLFLKTNVRWTLVAFQVTQNTRNLPVLESMMAMVRAILDNDNLFVEPYVRVIWILTFCNLAVVKLWCHK